MNLTCATTPRDRRNELRLAAATLIWALCFVGARQFLNRDALPGGIVPWLVAAAPIVATIFVILAFARYLGEADELLRLIQLQGLAWGFGGGFFAICGYSLFEPLGAPAVNGVDLLVVMPLFYVIGVLVGWRRYR